MKLAPGRLMGFAVLATLFLLAGLPLPQVGGQSSAAHRPAGRYVGSEACSGCHPAETAQENSAMAHALAPPQDSAILRSRPALTFQNGPYIYRVVRSRSGGLYTVSDGRRAITVPISWAFGNGPGGVGQTYVFRYGGYYFESQVSFYEGIQRLAITMGHVTYPPDSLGQALGYPLSDHEVTRCFACHATGAIREGQLDTQHMIPGITCEACHGPGAEHIAAVRSARLQDLRIVNPGRLSPAQITAFCGSCHRTTADEERLKVHGVENVRFQAYRLERSRCYGANSKAITCIGCHDPHGSLVTTPGYYDAKCLSCHGAAASAHETEARACPVASKNCVTCHMPKVKIPGVYYEFTDHFIRIVRQGQPYPS